MNNFGGNFGSSSGAQTFRHDHTGTNNYFVNSSGAHSHNVTGTSGSGGSHSHNVTGTSGSTGGGGSVDNRPPYYALCYIMKT